jgi:regulatory factor X
MRDLTLSQGKSFGSWWVTKAWIDEMVNFLAEQGGFMKQGASLSSTEVSQLQPVVKEVGQQDSRYDNGNENVDISSMPHTQSGRAPFPPPNTASHAPMGMSGNDAHDDSGIGIRTPEEDFPMDKYTFQGTETPGLGGTHGQSGVDML